MSNAAKSVFVFGIYAVVVGLGFLVIPNVLLPLFGFGATTEVWIRALGMVLVSAGYLYLQSGRNEVTSFFPWTVHGRAFVVVCFIAFVVLGLAKPMLLLFAAIDFLGALWTGLALRTSQG